MSALQPGVAEFRFRRRDLPHWEIAGRTYFVTFRLAQSLPPHVAEEYRKQLHLSRLSSAKPKAFTQSREEGRAFRDRYARYDAWLDRVYYGPRHLADPRIARMVSEAIQFYDGRRYKLIAYVVMPNHVHLVARPTEKPQPDMFWGLDEIMRGLKGYTGKKANEILQRSGEFWQREYFDHWIRNEEEWVYYVEYTRQNPVKAGLCARPEDWPWSGADPAAEGQ